MQNISYSLNVIQLHHDSIPLEFLIASRNNPKTMAEQKRLGTKHLINLMQRLLKPIKLEEVIYGFRKVGPMLFKLLQGLRERQHLATTQYLLDAMILKCICWLFQMHRAELLFGFLLN